MTTTNRTRSTKSRRNQAGSTLSTARENPVAAAAAIGGAVAAGVFLWARRSQIRDQIDNLSEQISDWRESSGDDIGPVGTTTTAAAPPQQEPGRSQREIAEEALTLKELGTAA